MAKTDKDDEGAKPLPPSLQLDWDDLPKLAPREHDFFMRVLRGDDCVDAFKASAAAHGFDQVRDWKEPAIWRAAHKMLQDVRIQTCIAAAFANGAGSGTITLAGHLRELERIREESRARGNMATALQAEMARGKAGGLYVERVEDVTPFDPVRILRRMAELDPELARARAAALNIPWEHIEGKPAPLRVTQQSTDEQSNANADAT